MYMSHVQVLKRINGEIEARRAAGEDLPPPPKTAIAGPEYFGLNQPEVLTQNSCNASRKAHFRTSLGLCQESERALPELNGRQEDMCSFCQCLTTASEVSLNSHASSPSM